METACLQLGIGLEEVELHWLAQEFHSAVENDILPQPWERVKYIDKDEVKYYYHNTDTAETSWDHPLLAMFKLETCSCRERMNKEYLADTFYYSNLVRVVFSRLKKHRMQI